MRILKNKYLKALTVRRRWLLIMDRHVQGYSPASERGEVRRRGTVLGALAMQGLIGSTHQMA